MPYLQIANYGIITDMCKKLTPKNNMVLKKNRSSMTKK